MFARKKVFVSWTIQGRLLAQLCVYFLFYNFLVWHAMFLIEMLPGEGVPAPIAERYADFASRHSVWLLCMLVTAPIVVWDMVKMTHRVAGPLVRLERTVRQMASGQRVTRITLREQDMLSHFVEALNELIDSHNRQLDAPDEFGSEDSRSVEPEPLTATAGVSSRL